MAPDKIIGNLRHERSMCQDRGARMNADLVRRHHSFALFGCVLLLVFWTPLTSLVRLAFQQEHYSHIILVPLIAGVMTAWNRRRIFEEVRISWRGGLGVMVAAALLYWLTRSLGGLSENDRLSLAILSFVLAGMSGFVMCYGLQALRAAMFPAAFLLLMVPLPDLILSRVILWLQLGTADVAEAMFQLTGVAFLRSGLAFELPGLIVEVAEECSGIRSSMALLITSLLAGYLFLRSAWAKGVLAILTLPLLLIKNGIRIVTISLLSIHVDPGFLTGSLHRRGGAVFFLLALGFVVAAVGLLQRAERFRRAYLHA
jgi:exosortase